MILIRISKSFAALALLVVVTACGPSDSPQKEASGKAATVEDPQRSGPDRGGPPDRDGPHAGGPPNRGGPPGRGGRPRGGEKRTVCDALKQGPMRSSEHGPMDNADLNRDGTVLREELETFMDQGQYRRITILTFFEQFDVDKNGTLSDEEFAMVKPPHGFDGTDADGDCVVTREEVVAYASLAGRSYRKIGLGPFFDQVDLNGDSKVTPTEVEAAHESGLLARF